MIRGIGRPTPAMAVAVTALFVALGGSAYAVSGIDGRSIKPKSIPGNRLVPESLAANRLKPGTIPGSRLEPGSVTGVQVDATTLGQVPSAVEADRAGTARDANRALYAQSAGDAASLNGHVATCPVSTRTFAGSCWQLVVSEAAATAPEAALACASQGGELPAALTLAAFAQQPGVVIASEGELTRDVEKVTGPGAYDILIVAPSGKIDWRERTESRKYRCVLPLLR